MIEFIKFDKVRQKHYLTESTRIANTHWEEMEESQVDKTFANNKFTVEEENERETIHFYQYKLK